MNIERKEDVHGDFPRLYEPGCLYLNFLNI